MALKILIADPDLEWANGAKKFFTERNYEVDSATNGKDAQLKIYNNQYFTIILNLQITNHSGFQVLKFIKSNHPGQRVIALLENEEIFEDGTITKESIGRMGAGEMLVKPFEFEELLGVLEGNQTFGEILEALPQRTGASDEVECSKSDADFTKVRIEEFLSGSKVIFDIYVRLAENKYIKILHAGDSFSKERIIKYRDEKKVQHLYFTNQDRKKYIRMANHIGNKFLCSPKLPSEKKVEIMRNLTEKFLEEVASEGMKPQVIDQGKQVCTNVFNLIENDENLWKLMREMVELDPSMYTHSYLVCLYASMLVKQFDWQSQVIIETIALSSVFHDIGKVKLDPAIREKRPDEMTDEEIQLYKAHPKMGAEMIENNPMITSSVKQVIAQHHEASDGSGFPAGLKDQKILTISKIVFLADEFTHFIVDHEIKPTEGIKKLLSNPKSTRRYNGLILENFLKVFVDPAKFGKKKGSDLPSNSKVISKKAS